MNRIKSYFEKLRTSDKGFNTFRQSLIFILLVLGMSYLILWGPIALLKIRTANLVEGKIYNLPALILYLIGGFVPSIVGIILTVSYEGKEGLKMLFRSAINFRIGFSSLLIIIVYVIATGSLQIILYTLVGGLFDYSQFLKQLPTIFPLMILGPLSEEFGWRGFLQKRIIKEFTSIRGSIIIGLIWSLWHLPLFYMIGTSQHDFNIPFIPFAISIISSSLVYTYLYIKTNGNLFSAILLHWLFTYILQVISSQITRTPTYNLLECLPALIIGSVFLILLRDHKTEIKDYSA
jgi:membrane protease YdiL (CAAX protease family)